MCGIFGLVLGEKSLVQKADFKKIIKRLFKLSESRGKEASGLALLNSNNIHIYKDSLPASKLIKTKTYNDVIDSIPVSNNDILGLPIALIGHSRLVTNGLQGISENNQPLEKKGIVGIHNGIVVNAV